MQRDTGGRMSWGLNIPNDQQLKLVVCTPQENKPPILEQFLQQLNGQTDLIRTDVQKFSEIAALVSEDPGALLLISVFDRDDLPEVIQMLSKLEQQIAAGTHKVIVYNQMNHEKLVSLLKSKGVTEVLEINVSLKAFQYKFNKVTQLLHQGVKRVKQEKKMKQDEVKHKRRVGAVTFIEPIEHFSDFWLLMSPKNVRFMIGKWFINFYGPGPSAGFWESYPESKNGEKGWIWKPRKEDDQSFYKDQGRWVFFGKCPEFSWEEKHWYFISKTPEFCFYQDQKVLHTKMKIQPSGDIHFCQNSQISIELQPAILDSIEASIRLRDNTKIKKDDGIIEEKISSKELVYQGRFPEKFEEKKKKHQRNYESAELHFGLTSKNGEKIASKINIELIELREKYAVLDVPAGLLVVDDQIELEAYLLDGDVEKKVTISAATQIVETEVDDTVPPSQLRSVAICELNDKIAPQFIELVNTFRSRRESMSNFFNEARGVA